MIKQFRVRAKALILVLAAIAAAPPLGFSAERPSFNCHKAETEGERAICDDAGLARLDRQLAGVWKNLIFAFSNEVQLSNIRRDQTSWLQVRNNCGSDVSCLQSTYRERLAQLTGSQGPYRLAGVYAAKAIGQVALYPQGQSYLVSIQTADPRSGAWTCEMAGQARDGGNTLDITVGTRTFQAQLQDPWSLVIPSVSADVAAIQASHCGLNGSIAFKFTRRKTP